jgi:nucleoside-diphosphate-sugar epimerase
MKPGRILVTGSTGFVGSHLVPWLAANGRKVRVALRNPADLPGDIESAVIGDIADPRNLSRALEDVDAVVHCAGVAHASHTIPDEVYARINRDATLELALAAQRAGVSRFVFLSSIRAQTGPVADGVLTEATPPVPTDAYGRSKLEAEQGLAALPNSLMANAQMASPKMDWVALRPVLVYGPGVKGNMRALVNLARSPWPLPLGSVTAKRSILAIDNLCSAIAAVIDAPEPLSRPLIVADPEALDVGQMVTAMRAGLGRKGGLLPVPEALLRGVAGLAGRGEAVTRLTGGLEVSPAALISLGWQPVVATKAALAMLAASPDA